MSRALYNENDPFAAQWLRNLAQAGHITEGIVDDRPIQSLKAADLVGHDRAHFFAGIGGWDLALRLAGWPADRPVWTGSCPCQPFSQAGRRRGVEDERHLWPVFFRLIRECRPATVFGEQVASKDGLAWLDGVSADLEAEGYAVGAADLCAAGVNAPHIRQRLFWVADSKDADRGRTARAPHGRRRAQETGGSGVACGLVNTTSGERRLPGFAWESREAIHCQDNRTRRIEPSAFPLAHGVPSRVGRLRGYGNAIVPQVAAEFVMAFMESQGPVGKGGKP